MSICDVIVVVAILTSAGWILILAARESRACDPIIELLSSLHCPGCGNQFTRQAVITQSESRPRLPPEKSTWLVDCRSCPLSITYTAQGEVMRTSARSTEEPDGG